jgi:hypothetical protein
MDDKKRAELHAGCAVGHAQQLYMKCIDSLSELHKSPAQTVYVDVWEFFINVNAPAPSFRNPKPYTKGERAALNMLAYFDQHEREEGKPHTLWMDWSGIKKTCRFNPTAFGDYDVPVLTGYIARTMVREKGEEWIMQKVRFVNILPVARRVFNDQLNNGHLDIFTPLKGNSAP